MEEKVLIIDHKTVSGNVSAVITAAGKGTRMKSKINKQYIELGGMPVLARTIAAFQNCSQVDDIVVVINEDDIQFCKDNIIDRYGFSKVKTLVSGGAERQNSVYKGLCAVDDKCKIVLIHDGARPFVTKQNIEASIENARIHQACGLGVRIKDTVKISNSEGFVDSTPDRNSLWSIQTPQSFEYKIIMKAHEEAIRNNFIGTDDMVLVEKIGIPVKIIEGSYMNIKITTPEDIIIGEAILKAYNL